MLTRWALRVKLPKTFLAVNLSDAFTFEEQERLANDNDMLEMKAFPPKDILSRTGEGEPVKHHGAQAEAGAEGTDQKETADPA